MCQTCNSVWILTCAMPDSEGSAMSPFHTHVLAIGRSSLDHTEVIDNYAPTIRKFIKGVIMFCGVTGRYMQVYIGLSLVVARRIFEIPYVSNMQQCLDTHLRP